MLFLINRKSHLKKKVKDIIKVIVIIHVVSTTTHYLLSCWALLALLAFATELVRLVLGPAWWAVSGSPQLRRPHLSPGSQAIFTSLCLTTKEFAPKPLPWLTWPTWKAHSLSIQFPRSFLQRMKELLSLSMWNEVLAASEKLKTTSTWANWCLVGMKERLRISTPKDILEASGKLNSQHLSYWSLVGRVRGSVGWRRRGSAEEC